MNAKEYLGVVIRIFGLFVALYGLYQGFYAIIELAGLVPDSHSPASRHALFAAIFLIIGICIVRTADHVVHFAYKKPWRLPSNDRDD